MEERNILFIGDRKSCGQFLRLSNSYYVYVLRRPDGRPFYVGKGTGQRVLHHENEARHPNDRRSNSHKLNVIRSIWRSNSEIIYEIVASFEDELSAYNAEQNLISGLRRLHEGGPLTNRAPGGGSKSGQSPFSRQKHSTTLGGIPDDDPETATLNRFVLSIGPMESIVLKPVSRFSCRPTQIFRNRARGPTLRQAIALAATACANGIPLTDGVLLPRSVCVEGVDGFVENGVSCAIASSRMARVISAPNPNHESFELDGAQVRALIGLIGLTKALELGIADLKTMEGKTA